MSLDLQPDHSDDLATTPDQTEPGGLAAGARVLTLAGEKNVESLRAGDRIITREGGMTVLKAVRQTAISGDLVCIRAGALGADLPARDTMLAPDQHLLLRSDRLKALFGLREALVRVGDLVDARRITRLADGAAVTFHLIFDKSQVIYADALELVAGCDDEAAKSVAA